MRSPEIPPTLGSGVPCHLLSHWRPHPMPRRATAPNYGTPMCDLLKFRWYQNIGPTIRWTMMVCVCVGEWVCCRFWGLYLILPTTTRSGRFSSSTMFSPDLESCAWYTSMSCKEETIHSTNKQRTSKKDCCVSSCSSFGDVWWTGEWWDKIKMLNLDMVMCWWIRSDHVYHISLHNFTDCIYFSIDCPLIFGQY